MAKSKFSLVMSEKKVLFTGTAEHGGVTSDHCRAVISSFFWQHEAVKQGDALAERTLTATETRELKNPESWVRSRKRTNIENMRRDIPNHEEIARKHGKIEEREFRNKHVKGIMCHIYSAGDEMLRFTAFKDDGKQ